MITPEHPATIIKREREALAEQHHPNCASWFSSPSNRGVVADCAVCHYMFRNDATIGKERTA